MCFERENKNFISFLIFFLIVEEIEFGRIGGRIFDLFKKLGYVS